MFVPSYRNKTQVNFHDVSLTYQQVRHIHARMGTKQSSQCPEPLNPVFAAERQFFEKFWLRIIKVRQQTDPDCRITWVPEYG